MVRSLPRGARQSRGGACVQGANGALLAYTRRLIRLPLEDTVLPHWSPLLSLLTLLLLANGAPAMVALLSGGAVARPLDGGRRWRDGRPVFGRAKTWRGLAVALILTPPAAWVLGCDWGLGLTIALGAMAGDLIASFTKRRLGLPSSAAVPVLDQVPETLIPALLVKASMGLDWLDLGQVVLAFTALDLLLTPVLRRWGAARVR